MGVKGLYTYVSSRVPKAFDWMQLKDCKLVIDGSNLAYHILLYSNNIHLAYGGDYAKFAGNIYEFFNKLLICNITPLVVIDGGHPLHNKKLETTKSRIVDQLTSCQIIDPKNQNLSRVFPLLIRIVFTNVLLKMGIKCITADFEADDDIAVIAKHLNCYVLSNDTDFFLHDVKLILLQSINMDSVKNNGSKSRNYIACYKFNRRQFGKDTGVHLQLLPLLALIVGNDCHKVEIMVDFINSVSRGKYSALMLSKNRFELIESALKWLSFQESSDPSTVVRKITSRLKHLSNTDLVSIRDCLKSYHPKSSALLPWFIEHDKTCPLVNVFVEPKPVFLVDFKCNSNIPDYAESHMKCSCRQRQQSSLGFDKGLPKWFTFCFRFNIAPCIITELLNQPSIFALPVIEDTDKRSVHLPFENILKSIRRILWKTATRPDAKYAITSVTEANKSVKSSDVAFNSEANLAVLRKAQKSGMMPTVYWYLRRDTALWSKAITESPLKSIVLPDLSTIENLPIEDKKELFFKLSDLRPEFLCNETLPKNLEFILMFIYDWKLKSEDLKDSVFYSVIISAIMFLIVSGRHVLKKEKVHPSTEEKYLLKVDSVLATEDVSEWQALSITEIIESLTLEECQLARFNLSLFNRETNKLRSNYKRSTIHQFSAYQCSVYYLGVLNSVLGFPFPLVCISNFWSGTFCYSIERFLDSEKNAMKAVKLLLNVNKKIIHIFDRICDLFHKAFEMEMPRTIDTVNEEELDLHKKKIKTMASDKIEKECNIIESRREYDTIEFPTDEDMVVLSGNRFGSLLLNSHSV